METQECREKNDQAKAKQAEQWANLVSQVGPPLLGNTNTVVLFVPGSISQHFFKDYYYFCHFIWLCCRRFTLCASSMQAFLLLLAFSESKSTQNGCFSLDPLSPSKRNNTA